MGRLPDMKSSAELNRPQAGGYSICEISLGPQMLREPLGGGFHDSQCRDSLHFNKVGMLWRRPQKDLRRPLNASLLLDPSRD